MLRREPFHGRCHCAFRFASRTWVRLQLDCRLKHQEKQGILQKQLLTSFLHLSYHIGVTLNVYTHLGLEDAAAEMARMEEVETVRKEQEKISGKKDKENMVTQKMFRAV